MANIIIFLILLGFLPQSYAETYLEGCFNHKNLAVQAIQDIQFLKVPTDKIQHKNGCINIYTSEQRIDLYRKYLRRNYDVKFYDSSAVSSEQECQLIITRVTDKNSNSKIAGLQNQQIALGETEGKSQSRQSTKLILMEGLPGSFQYNDSNYGLKCFKTDAGYNIEITSTSRSLSFQTKRFVKAGEEIELGEIIQNQVNDSRKANINSGLVYKDDNNQNTEKLYLKVER